MLGVRLGVVGILAREDVKVLTVYVDLSVICVVTNKTTTIVGSNLQANANNAVNSNNSNNANNAVNTGKGGGFSC
jgi:hypothetical protein